MAPLTVAPQVLATDMPASSTLAQRLLDWAPTHPGLITSTDEGHYFRTD